MSSSARRDWRASSSRPAPRSVLSVVVRSFSMMAKMVAWGERRSCDRKERVSSRSRSARRRAVRSTNWIIQRRSSALAPVAATSTRQWRPCMSWYSPASWQGSSWKLRGSLPKMVRKQSDRVVQHSPTLPKALRKRWLRSSGRCSWSATRTGWGRLCRLSDRKRLSLATCWAAIWTRLSWAEMGSCETGSALRAPKTPPNSSRERAWRSRPVEATDSRRQLQSG